MACGIALGLLAAWFAAGSCGPLAYSLQALIVWTLLLAAVILVRPQPGFYGWIAALAVLLTAVWLPVLLDARAGQLLLLVGMVFGLLAAAKPDPERRLLALGGTSVVVLALYHMAQTQVPAIWLATERLGAWLGYAIGVLTGKPLEIGASFAGLDFLVLSITFVLVTLPHARRPRWPLLVFCGICLVLGQAMYLAILGHTQQIVDRLPPAALPTQNNPYVPPDFCWSTILRARLPWNLPILCAVIHGSIVLLFLRWSTWNLSPAPSSQPDSPTRSVYRRRAMLLLPLLLAAAIPIFGSLRTTANTLAGKRILANQQDDIDYLVAEHGSYGQQSAGMFGLLPRLVKGLGGHFQESSTFSDTQLQQADVLLLLHPNQTTAEQYERIWQYIRNGGSVAVITSGFSPETGLDSSSNDVLRGTSITVSQDAAHSDTGDWQESLVVFSHSAVTTTDPRTARCWSDSGASLHIGWGAKPLVVGRWGWSAPQLGATWKESHPLETHARLGDLVLAAEQRIGRGRIVVLGDDTSFLNEGLVKGYALVGNVLAYLAHPPSGPQRVWRQWLGLLACLVLGYLLVLRNEPLELIAVSLVLAVSVAACQSTSHHAAQVIPDGSRIEPSSNAVIKNSLAYIDQSHLEAYSLDDWGFDSLNGLPLNLVRNGYLPLLMPSFSAERLAGAGLFISIAPARPYTPAERAAVRTFVERGGILICMVGAEQAAASNPLLADFGLHIPVSPAPTGATWPEPEPFGRTRALYLNVENPETHESYQVGMRLYAAWPVEPLADDIEVLAYGHNELRVVDSDTELPVIISRQVGDGTVVLIGDSSFALNKNLEYIGGEAFEGGHENADFWRWLLARVTGQKEWVPPPPASRSASSENATHEAEGEK